MEFPLSKLATTSLKPTHTQNSRKCFATTTTSCFLHHPFTTIVSTAAGVCFFGPIENASLTWFDARWMVLCDYWESIQAVIHFVFQTKERDFMIVTG